MEHIGKFAQIFPPIYENRCEKKNTYQAPVRFWSVRKDLMPSFHLVLFCSALITGSGAAGNLKSKFENLAREQEEVC